MIDFKTGWARVKGRWRTWRHVPTLLLSGDAAGAAAEDAALAAFARWCETHPGAVCRVGLSAGFLLNSVPELGATSPSAREQAMQQWAHYLDMDVASLAHDWVVREVHVKASSLLCAAPASLMQGLQTCASEHGVRLDWVGPWWAHGVQTWLDDLPSPEGDAEVANTLHVQERDLVTHVEVLRVSGQLPRLLRVWTDRRMPSALEANAAAVRLPALVVLADRAGSAWPALCDDETVARVLTGRDACWQVAA